MSSVENFADFRLTSENGARWVVSTASASEPGYWVDDSSLIPQNGSSESFQDCIALTSEESNLECGTLSLEELVKLLQKFWANFADLFDLEFTNEGETKTSTWLTFFRENNYTFGYVHAWASAWVMNPALMAPDQWMKMSVLAQIRCGEEPSRFADDEFYPSTQVFEDDEKNNYLRGASDAHQRRVWDICANRVIPLAWITVKRDPRPFAQRNPILPGGNEWPEKKMWAISHAWVEEPELQMTPINHNEWPVPVPPGVSLDAVRNELLQFGCRYVWLDVLCMRQKYPADPTREALRNEEWKVDVPLIGAIYQGLTRTVVVYFSGLGRPFVPEGWSGDRHWLNRAWTLQETLQVNNIIVGGVGKSRQQEVFQSVIDTTTGLTLGQRVQQIAEARQRGNFPRLLKEITTRHVSRDHEVDKVGALCLFPQLDRVFAPLPLYQSSEQPESAWRKFCMTQHDGTLRNKLYLNILILFPNPSSQHWFPSWAQLNQFPNVSITEPEAPDPTTLIVGRYNMGFAYTTKIHPTLRFTGGGGIYRGCRFQEVEGSRNSLAVTFTGLPDLDHKLIFVSLCEDQELHRGRIVLEEQEYILLKTAQLGELGDNYRTPHIFLVCREIGCTIGKSNPNERTWHLRRVTTLGLLNDPVNVGLLHNVIEHDPDVHVILGWGDKGNEAQGARPYNEAYVY